MKIVLDFSAKLGREGIFTLTFRNESSMCIYLFIFFFFPSIQREQNVLPFTLYADIKLSLHNKISTKNVLEFHCN